MNRFEIIDLMIDKAKAINEETKEAGYNTYKLRALQAQAEVLMETVSIVQDSIDKELWYGLNTPKK